MRDQSFEAQPPERTIEKRLDSWKEIAVYLNRDVTTVQRWEKREGMPVHGKPEPLAPLDLKAVRVLASHSGY